jgi:hypothetical protein
MSYVELYSKDILGLINTGKTTSDFNESMGDYIKVEIFRENSDTLLGTMYSNRLLLNYGEADDYYIGDYHYHDMNGFMEGKVHTDQPHATLLPIPVVDGPNEPLDSGTVYKKQIEIFKDDNDRIFIKPNDILKLLKLPKNKYRLRVHFLRNIKSTLGSFLNLMGDNLIENGNFFAGLEATQTGDLDRSSGKNNFARIPNPGLSPYVLEQNGLPGNEYVMRVTGITPNTKYVFSCWVAWDNVFNGSPGMVGFGRASSDFLISGLLEIPDTSVIGTHSPDIYSDRVLSTKTLGGVIWYRLYSFVETSELANLGSIDIHVGAVGSNAASTAPLGKRCFTDLRFVKVDSLMGAPIIEYLDKLKLENNVDITTTDSGGGY